MKLVVFLTLCGWVAAEGFGQQRAAYNALPEQSNRPQAAFERSARILALDSDVKETGFRFNFETENGIKAEEVGQEADGIEAQGGFQYTGDDGQIYSVSYAAGQAGFQPQGAHFPTAPPTPEAILKALEQNAADEAAGIVDDGLYHPEKYGGGGGQVQPQFNNRPYKF